ncbi:MAG TPA: PfkB family carbohydrate kinase [Polyangia bacterium]|nr:PfkB family carbohydrate kinase [Polyangia bacterium]
MALPQIQSPQVVESPQVVVVGGLDPGGGAGLLRDLATVAALGARAHAVGTAWTEQGNGVHRVEPRDPAAVRQALAHALATLKPGAVKIGMAVGPATGAALREALTGFGGPVVVDPVLASSRGGSLWADAPGALLPLLRRATLVTPNAVEAAALAGCAVTTPDEAEAAARQLVETAGLAAVLVKGGHLAADGGEVVDLLVTRSQVVRLRRPRLAGASPRGTGCALATAIAVELARGRELATAAASGGEWLAGRIAAARDVGGERRLP